MRLNSRQIGFVLLSLCALTGSLPALAHPSSDPLVLHSNRRFVSQNQHSDFAFDFTSGSTNASGLLHTTDNGDGTFTATGGFLTVTGTDAGTYNLFTTPEVNPTDEVLSPSSFFLFDNQVLLGQPELLTEGGLLFRADGVEINLFGDENGSHTFYDNRGYHTNGLFSPMAGVPELSSVLSFGSLITLGGLTALRRARKSRPSA